MLYPLSYEGGDGRFFHADGPSTCGVHFRAGQAPSGLSALGDLPPCPKLAKNQQHSARPGFGGFAERVERHRAAFTASRTRRRETAEQDTLPRGLTVRQGSSGCAESRGGARRP